MFKEIVIIGSGNVASHLAWGLQQAGFVLKQLYGRNVTTTKNLAQQLSIDFTCDKTLIYTSADCYIVCVKDSEIENVLTDLNLHNKVILHTAGSISIDILSRFSDQIGVLYPLQTFTKNRTIDWKSVPIYIEGNTPNITHQINELACKLSNTVHEISSEKRKNLHMAAVFACNFVNHLYTLAAELAHDSEINFDELLPLIKETYHKVEYLSPKEAQTGPAMRYDKEIVNKHIQYLEQKDSSMAKIYRLLSKSIFDKHHTNY